MGSRKKPTVRARGTSAPSEENLWEGWEDVSGGLGGPTFLKRQTADDGSYIECYYHPEWHPALDRLQQGDPEPFALLCRTGRHIPPEIAGLSPVWKTPS